MWRVDILPVLKDVGISGLQDGEDVKMREFDAICPPPVRELSAADIKRLREALKFSQPVFALHLHTSASTVRKWEQGETHPTGPALKLLNIIADKGLQAII
jgi:putative transcriptional regulator